MLLTGTFNQYRALVPSVENGYFSRLLTVVIRGTNPFDKRYVSSRGRQSIIPRQIGHRLLRTYESLLGDNFHSAVIRMAVQIERIAMILTAMRGAGNELRPASNAGIIDKGIRLQDDTTDERDDKDRPYMVDTIYCSDQDYEAAEMIGNKLLLHMASAYRMIDGDAGRLEPNVSST